MFCSKTISCKIIVNVIAHKNRLYNSFKQIINIEINKYERKVRGLVTVKKVINSNFAVFTQQTMFGIICNKLH